MPGKDLNTFFKTYDYPKELKGLIEPWHVLGKLPKDSYVAMMLDRIDKRRAIKKRGRDADSEDQLVKK